MENDSVSNVPEAMHVEKHNQTFRPAISSSFSSDCYFWTQSAG